MKRKRSESTNSNKRPSKKQKINHSLDFANAIISHLKNQPKHNKSVQETIAELMKKGALYKLVIQKFGCGAEKFSISKRDPRYNIISPAYEKLTTGRRYSKVFLKNRKKRKPRKNAKKNKTLKNKSKYNKTSVLLQQETAQKQTIHDDHQHYIAIPKPLEISEDKSTTYAKSLYGSYEIKFNIKNKPEENIEKNEIQAPPNAGFLRKLTFFKTPENKTTTPSNIYEAHNNNPLKNT